ncbi:MAG: hypothetical protein IPM53_06275 [Anaerolineaceae bacterium]|nr:hypothetical protein [Anaerolineaceae bacterium]
MWLNRQRLIFGLEIIFCVFLFVIAFRLLTPSRNWFGNPNSERKILECSLPDREAVVRLYHGYHSSITGRDWTSVTYQPNQKQPEKQFFYSYGTPFISEVFCKEDSVSIGFGPKFTIAYEFSILEIETQLTRRPEGLRYGESEVATIQPLRLLKIYLALALFVAGAGILILSIVRIFGMARGLFSKG